MKPIFLALVLVISCISGIKSQQLLPDSLQRIAARVNHDSAAALNAQIAYIYTGVNSDSVRKFARRAGKMARAGSVVRGDVLIQIGNSYHMENNMDSALHYYQKGLEYFQSIGNEKGVGKAYQSFGIVKRTAGDPAGAIEAQKKALEIYLKIGWDLGIVNVYNNISASYNNMSNYEEALKYSRGALARSRLLNDSLKYFGMMSEYGGRLARAGRPDSALFYLKAATPYLERNHMYNLLIPSYSGMAGLFLYSNSPDLSAAKKLLLKVQEYALKSGAADNLRYVYQDLAQLYLRKKQIDSASYFFVRTISFIDSLTAQNAAESSKEIETRYETEKKELQLQKQALMIEAAEEEARLKSRQMVFGGIALLLICVFATFAFAGFLRVRRSNRIIHEQKLQVEKQKEEIMSQKQLIEIKQTEMIDSINYAKRIQQAVLTGSEIWKKISPDYFIMFRPKDIVSGDFYWAYNSPGDISVFALADCTGHGVPGAFMSMLGNSFLNEIVVEQKILKANEILDRLRAKIIAALDQEGNSERRDGMDISLCVYDRKSSVIEFAGANNPLLVLCKDGIKEIKGDKMPVGLHVGEVKPFRSEYINAERGDIIYMSTDGFSDQFGGPKEKKFTFRQLKEILSVLRNEPMAVQKKILEQRIIAWQGAFEQIDDISIIGVRV